MIYYNIMCIIHLYVYVYIYIYTYICMYTHIHNTVSASPNRGRLTRRRADRVLGGLRRSARVILGIRP